MCPLMHASKGKSFFVRYLVTAMRQATNASGYILLLFFELNADKEIPKRVTETVTISLFKNTGHDPLNYLMKH